MTVQELINVLQGMNKNADVYVINPNTGEYDKVVDCEEDNTDTVSLGTIQQELKDEQ